MLMRIISYLTCLILFVAMERHSIPDPTYEKLLDYLGRVTLDDVALTAGNMMILHAGMQRSFYDLFQYIAAGRWANVQSWGRNIPAMPFGFLKMQLAW